MSLDLYSCNKVSSSAALAQWLSLAALMRYTKRPASKARSGRSNSSSPMGLSEIQIQVASGLHLLEYNYLGLGTIARARDRSSCPIPMIMHTNGNTVTQKSNYDSQVAR